jgi:hypothetical protein
MSKVFTGNLELFKEFIAFCESQPVYKKINHDTWDSCAVGEFFTATGRDVDEHYARDMLGMDIEFPHKDGELVILIGNADCPDLYGEFTEFLKSYLPEDTV